MKANDGGSYFALFVTIDVASVCGVNAISEVLEVAITS
jgi:hypothetical protein